MIALADRLGESSGWICGPPDFRSLLEEKGLGDLDRLGSRALGEPVTDHRTSWVRLVSMDLRPYYIKTYDYPRGWDRCRGFLRNTVLAPSRARREWQALTWLRARGFEAPEPMGVMEKRRWGWLRRAILISRAWPGHPAHVLLPLLGARDRSSLIEAVRGHLQRLHAAGFRDGNADLRNFLARRTGTGWKIAKIDSPRYAIVKPGRRDRGIHRDLERLAASLDALGPDFAPG